MRDELSLPLLYSATAHLSLILLLTIKAVLFPETITVLPPAIRVDLVDLPDKIGAPPPVPMPTPKKEPPELPSKAEVQKPPLAKESKDLKQVKSEELNLEERKKKESKGTKDAKDAIEKIKKQAAIDKIREQLQSQQRSDLENRVNTYKGQVLSPGTELTGVNLLQHEQYLSSLDGHVKGFWSLPEWLARGNYGAQVRVFIDETGHLLKVELVRSSGHSEYDDTVMETVKKASPFPAPPEKFRAIMSVKGMLLGFPE